MSKCLLLAGVLLVLSLNVAAEIPQLISYQGRLTDDDGGPTEGSFMMTFCIYGSSSDPDTIWTSGQQSVDVVGGLFSYTLGSNVVLPQEVFNGAERFLGITVGTDTEIAPRTRLTSAAFSYHAAKADTAEFVLSAPGNFVETTGDTMTGGIVFDAAGPGIEGHFQVGETYSNIFLFNSGSRKAALYGQGYGSLVLSDDDGTNTVFLNARYNKGGSIQLRNNSGVDKIVLDAELTGDTAVVFPSGAISAEEMFNEPGVSTSESESSISGVTFDYVVVNVDTIIVPAPGYIVAIGGLTVSIGMPASAGLAQCYVGIGLDSSSIPSNTWKYLIVDSTTTHEPYIPVTVFNAITCDTAGTYIVKLYLGDWDNTSAFWSNNANIITMYFPTAYGSTPYTVSQGDGDLPHMSMPAIGQSKEIGTRDTFDNTPSIVNDRRDKLTELEDRIQQLENELKELKDSGQQGQKP